MKDALLDKLVAAPGRLFFFDGIGAMVSALLLGGVLITLQPQVGMPSPTLRMLAGVAALFSLVSLTCSRFLPTKWRTVLLGLAGANLSYCLITAGLVLKYADDLQPLGWFYFGAEILIILRLISLEIAVARRG